MLGAGWSNAVGVGPASGAPRHQGQPPTPGASTVSDARSLAQPRPALVKNVGAIAIGAGQSDPAPALAIAPRTSDPDAIEPIPALARTRARRRHTVEPR